MSISYEFTKKLGNPYRRIKIPPTMINGVRHYFIPSEKSMKIFILNGKYTPGECKYCHLPVRLSEQSYFINDIPEFALNFIMHNGIYHNECAKNIIQYICVLCNNNVYMALHDVFSYYNSMPIALIMMTNLGNFVLCDQLCPYNEYINPNGLKLCRRCYAHCGKLAKFRNMIHDDANVRREQIDAFMKLENAKRKIQIIERKTYMRHKEQIRNFVIE